MSYDDLPPDHPTFDPPIKYYAVKKDTGEYGVYETLEEARLNCDDDNWEVRMSPTTADYYQPRDYNDAEGVTTMADLA